MMKLKDFLALFRKSARPLAQINVEQLRYVFAFALPLQPHSGGEFVGCVCWRQAKASTFSVFPELVSL
jgi:hypothetical protein